MREEADGTQVWSGEFEIGLESSLPGELRYHPVDGIELRTFGRSERFGEIEEYELITGCLEGSQPVTLVDCFDTDSRLFLPKFVERRILVNFALLGIALENQSDELFHSFRFQSPALTAWYVPGDLTMRSSRGPRHNMTIRYAQRGRIRHRLDDRRTVTFWSGPAYSFGLDPEGKMNFRVVVTGELRYRKRQSWRQMLQDWWVLEQFFSLATGYLSGPPEVHLVVKQEAAKDPEGGPAKLETQKIRYLNSQPWYKPAPIGHVRECTYTLRDGRAETGVVLGRWFSFQPWLSRVLSLYMSAIESNLSIEARFLLLIQAAEALHREAVGGQLMSDKQFHDVRDNLKDAIPDKVGTEVARVLEQRLDFLNELGLAKRIKDICRTITDVKTLFPDYRSDARLAAKHRNNLVHALRFREPIDQVVLEVEYLSEFLRAILDFSILSLVGVKGDVLHAIASRNRRFIALGAHRRAMVSRHG